MELIQRVLKNLLDFKLCIIFRKIIMLPLP